MIMCANAITLADPPISFFIRAMLAAGFKSNPPVSKQTPLPTKVIFGPALPHLRSIKRGSCSAARPTAWIIGKFWASNSSPTMTLNSAICCAANSRTASASSAGPISAAGVLIRSRHRISASTIAAILSASAQSGLTNCRAGRLIVLYRSKRY